MSLSLELSLQGEKAQIDRNKSEDLPFTDISVLRLREFTDRNHIFQSHKAPPISVNLIPRENALGESIV